jgi:BON domain
VGKTKDVRAAVEAELGFDSRVDAKGITVRNINGEVALDGTVPSYPQYLEAAAAARRVTGVTRVHNHLEVVLSPGDYRDDAMLTTAANETLERAAAVPDGADRSCPHPGRTRRGGQRRGDGQRRHRRSRRPPHHRLNARPRACIGPSPAGCQSRTAC